MDKKIIIANWKAYLSLAESEELAKNILKFIKNKKDLPEMVFCPSFPCILPIAKVLKNTDKIKLGAQNMCWCEMGAYTGEVPANLLNEVGCDFVILGHSERRKHFHEKNLDIHYRVKAALEHGLTPIICVGETYEERRQGKRDEVVRKQTIESVGVLDLKPSQRVILAYEPVWVIGSGRAVEPEDAVHSHRVIKQALVDSYSQTEFNLYFQIIYGGSVDPQNLQGFIEHDIISGVLVGGASTKEDSFKGLIEVCIK